MEKKMLKKLAIGATFAISMTAASAMADQIRIAGSSTVYPFTTVAAEEFGRSGDYATPIVEATGTGGGFKIFCAGVDDGLPDFVNASRAIKESEVKLCAKHGIKDITEIKLGYDGIVLANASEHSRVSLTTAQIFAALAKQVPQNGKLIDNPNVKWSDIDSSLPDEKIEVYGPPPTSGTRDAFVELVMEKACVDLPEYKKAYEDKKIREKVCHELREDGHFIEVGENDNLIVQKLKANPNALGLFGFSFLDQNNSIVQGSIIDEVVPSFDTISSGEYAISRPLFVYMKDAKLNKKGVKEFAQELTSENAIGIDGYLIEKGLIPLHEDEFDKLQETIASKI